MPTLNLLAELLLASDELDKAQRVLDRKQKTIIGRLPIVRTKLNSAQIDLDVQRIRVEAAKDYLIATEDK